MENSFQLVTVPGEGSCLAVLSPASADAGLIADEMALLVKRTGPPPDERPPQNGREPQHTP